MIATRRTLHGSKHFWWAADGVRASNQEILMCAVSEPSSRKCSWSPPQAIPYEHILPHVHSLNLSNVTSKFSPEYPYKIFPYGPPILAFLVKTVISLLNDFLGRSKVTFPYGAPILAGGGFGVSLRVSLLRLVGGGVGVKTCKQE